MKTINARRKATLSLTAGMALSMLAGCQQGEGEAPTAVTDAEAATVGTAVVAATPLFAPPGEIHVPASAVPVQSLPQEPTVAAIAFEQLITPGISAEQWEQAHERLVNLGTAAADVLKAGLRSNNPLAREGAASILALNAEAAQSCVQELTACLDDRSGFIRANAASALAFVPGEEGKAVPVFLQLLLDADPQLRRMAAMNLGAVPTIPPAQLPALAAALNDSDPEVVRPLVELCGRLGPTARTALPRLQQIAFEQTDAALQSAAQQAVQLIQQE